MEISKLFGLPAHPLLVHVPVVVVPLVGLGAIAMAVSAKVRDRIGWLVFALAAVALVGVQLAIGSGQALQDSVPRSHALSVHVQTAESLRPLVLLLVVVVGALMARDRRTRRRASTVGATGTTPAPAPTRRLVSVGLGIAAVVVAVGANVRLAQIGHNGAAATWQRVQIRPGGGDESLGAKAPAPAK